MSADFDGTACDAEAARLLPWFLTRTLSAADTERVARHFEHCEICSADLAHEQAIRAMMKAEGPIEYAPQSGLATTLARIDELSRETSSTLRDDSVAREIRSARPRPAVTRWLTAAIIVQAIGLGVLAGSIAGRPGSERVSARYETLSSPAVTGNGAWIRSVFTASMTIGELRVLLGSQRLLILAGPSDAGVFTLGSTENSIARDRLDALLAGLRADPHVLFAEPAIIDRVMPP